MICDIVAVYHTTKIKALHARRGEYSKCLALIPKGARVDAIEEPRDGVVRVRYEGRVGYCLACDLSNVEDEPE